MYRAIVTAQRCGNNQHLNTTVRLPFITTPRTWWTMVGNNIAIDWSALFFSEGLPDKLTAAAERRFGQSPDAGAAYNSAFEKISEDNWQRLRDRYKGTGSPAAFLSVTFLNLLEDYARSKYGKKVPPVWIKRLGPLWTRIYQLLCLERLLPETIVDAITARADHSTDEIRYAIRQIKGRVPDCGAYLGEQAEDEQVLCSAAAEGIEPSEELEITQQMTMLDVLRGMAIAGSEAGAEKGPTTTGNPRSSVLEEQVVDAVKAVALTDQERLLLKLHYEERYTITAAAAALGIERKPASRMHERAMKRLNKALEPLGLQDLDAG